ARDLDLEVLCPIAARVGRRLLPVVGDLPVDEHGPLARHEPEERALRVREWHPGAEVGLRAKRVDGVVAKDAELLAGEYQRAVEARGRERLLETLLHDREMCAVLARERVLERLGRSELAAGGERADCCRAGQIEAQPFKVDRS